MSTTHDDVGGGIAEALAARDVRALVAADPSCEERFWLRVSPGEAHECWPWRGALYWSPDGDSKHGVFNVGRHAFSAHRFLWELWVGPLWGVYLSNHCGRRDCVNPTHWRLAGRRSRSPRLTAAEAQAIGISIHTSTDTPARAA